MNTISQIKAKRNSDSCIVIMDDTEFIINTDIILKYALKKEMQLSFELFEQILKEQKIIDCKKAAYNYACYKPRTEFQIIQKLKTQKYTDNSINIAVEFLKKFNLIDDEKFAYNYINHIAKSKRYGINRIKMELKKLGVAESIIENSLKENIHYDTQFETALQAYNKKKRAISAKPIDKQKNSLINHLALKGFNWDIIKKCIENDEDFSNRRY